jgi:hypothetical protein
MVFDFLESDLSLSETYNNSQDPQISMLDYRWNGLHETCDFSGLPTSNGLEQTLFNPASFDDWTLHMSETFTENQTLLSESYNERFSLNLAESFTDKQTLLNESRKQGFGITFSLPEMGPTFENHTATRKKRKKIDGIPKMPPEAFEKRPATTNEPEVYRFHCTIPGCDKCESD